MGNIAEVVWGTNGTSNGASWTLAQVHLHWGRSRMTNEGSEHFLQGVSYPAEVHLVHYNTGRGKSLTEALSSGATDALLVVGIFLTLGPSESPFISYMAGLAPLVPMAPTTIPQALLFSDLFNGMDSFYSYPGSLTTPPCTEAVTWVVLQTPKQITLGSLQALKMASLCPPAVASSKFNTLATAPKTCNGNTIATYGNFRPLQSINDRSIYSSAGPTAGCTTNVTAPNFYCNAQPNLVILRNAASGVHSSLPILLLALALLASQSN